MFFKDFDVRLALIRKNQCIICSFKMWFLECPVLMGLIKIMKIMKFINGGLIIMKKFEWKTIKTKVGNGRKKFIAVTVVLCLVAAAAGGAITHTNRSNAEENKVVSSDVGTGTIKESVSGTGSISYASTTDIVLPTQLEMKEVILG